METPQKIISPMSSSTIGGFNIGPPIRAISLAPSKSQLMVGGRDVLQILEIKEDLSISQKINFHSRRKSNLSMGAEDIQWNQKNENMVITSSPNCQINVWDIEAYAKNKAKGILRTYHEQQKKSKLCWDPFNPNRFISGSMDSSIKLFDIQLEKSVFEMSRKKQTDDHVNFVKFNPLKENIFAACYGNGIVDIWDLTMQSKPIKELRVSIKNVFCMDWHPLHKEVLITGSYDRSIKVWNINDPVSQADRASHQQITPSISNPLFQILSPSSVKKCVWVPNKPFMITSISLDDPQVSVWHCKKRFLQQYIFKGTKDSVSDFEWISPSESLISAVGGTIRIQHISKAHRPYQGICTSAVDFNLYDDIAFINDKLKNRDPDEFLKSLEKESTQDQQLFEYNKQTNKSMQEEKIDEGILQIYDSEIYKSPKIIDVDNFEDSQIETLAQNYIYRITEDYPTIESLCQHNAQVAEDMRLDEIRNSWESLQKVAEEVKIISQCVTVQSQKVITQNQTIQSKSFREESKTQSTKLDFKKSLYPTENRNYMSQDKNISFPKPRDIKTTRKYSQSYEITQLLKESSGELNKGVQEPEGVKVFSNEFLDIEVFDIQEEESDKEILEESEGKSQSDNDLSPSKLDYLPKVTSQIEKQPQPTIQQSLSPKVAKQPLPIVPNIVGGEENINYYLEMKPVKLSHSKHHQGKTPKKPNHQVFQASQGNTKKLPPMQKWIYEIIQETVIDTVKFYADNGEIQTAAIMCIVFFEYLDFKKHEAYICRVITSYLELLKRYSLFSYAAELIKKGPQIEYIQRFYKLKEKKSFSVAIQCPYCKSKEDNTIKHWCKDKRCLKIASRCSICDLPVKSLYLWCQGCSHGGHSNHLLKWFKENKYCPAGCGHQCIE